MNIYDPYPTRICALGKRYRLDLEYDNVLRALDVQSATLPMLDKQEVMLRIFLHSAWRCPRDPRDQSELLLAILSLFPKSENKAQQRYIDFHQDARLIRSAFLRMGIDLTKERIHFFKFLELLADIPEDTALAKVIEIRQRPIPEPTKHNGKQIAALMEAKAKVAIQIPEEERRRKFAESLKNSQILRG
ncbi:MAG: hypothetical protein J6S50_02305 [Oscillospiraceae bacterium]|nr:hypothetical protein [Oscillospiraceae bacterium]